MDISIFFAKFFGIFMLLFAAMFVARKDQVETGIREVFASRGLLALDGVIYLIVGLTVVILHSIWTLSWHGLVTLLGYLLVVKGVMRIAFPDTVKRVANEILDKGYWPLVVFMVVVGGYLTYSGFWG